MNSIFVLSMPGTAEWIILVVMGLIPIICIFDIMNNSFRGTYAKLIWCGVVVFFPIIGSLLYVWIGREQRVIN